MKLKTTKLRSAIILALVAVPVSMPLMAQEESDDATRLDTVTVTGSRIKRADIEGSVPVVVIDRTQIEASGSVMVADFLRETQFNTFGSYQSSSGSSGAGATTVSLRGLGAERTLILIDGRRAPVAPQLGAGQDLNSIPMAAVERIEILTDGASAVYGSDALGGVVNVITRKDYDGVEISYGRGMPKHDGGDTEEASILIGASSDRGRVIAGASFSERDMIFNRDRDYWYAARGESVYSNNFLYPIYNAAGQLANIDWMTHPEHGSAVPGLCTNNEGGFWLSGDPNDPAGSTCQFDHLATSATVTSMKNSSVFARGDYEINDDWLFYFDVNSTEVKSFGRYAPLPSSPWVSPGYIRIPAGSPNHPATSPENGGLNPHYQPGDYYSQYADDDLYLTHRFAALGTRDGNTTVTTRNVGAGFQGVVGKVDLDFGARYTQSRGFDKGDNYVVATLAQPFISSGEYNIYDPWAGDPASLGFTTTILRDYKTELKEVYGSGAFDLFSMGGGTAAAVIGAEYREELYEDNYDMLSEAGVVSGSAGNSAGGSRDLKAAFFEVLLPVTSTFEVNIAGRYDEYSDYGSDFSPKLSLRWQPLENLTLRGSYGEGFRAPSMDILTAKASFSADATNDEATCIMLTGNPVCNTQINTWRIANPNLGSETSKQYTFGAVWDATDWLNLSLDYYNIEIDNRIAFVGASTIISCLRGTTTFCPPGLSFFPEGTRNNVPDESLGLGVELDPATGGIRVAQTGYANLGTVNTDGVDFRIETRFDLGNFGTLRNRFAASYMIDQHVNEGDNYVGQPEAPRIRGGLQNIWAIGDFDVNWNIDYIHRTQSYIYRTWISRVVNNGYTGSLADLTDGLGTKHIPSMVTHNVQVSYKAPWDATITLGVNNLLDRDPSMDPYYAHFGQGDPLVDLYSVLGRVPYFRYTQRF